MSAQTPSRRAMAQTVAGRPPWNPGSQAGKPTIEAEAAITLLSGDAPWLPGATFSADPVLAAYLRSCLRGYTPEKRAAVLAAIKRSEA